MRKPIQIISLFLILIMLSACGTTPAETTPPPTTAPAVTEPVETTVPMTTEPPAPDGFVCLNKMFEDSDIKITIEGSDIILNEDGLILKMSTENKDVYRDVFIVGVMKENPIVEDGTVYIHGQFFDYFFRKEGSDTVSLFHNIWFYPDEACTAVETPDASVFNAKVCAEILLPQSMGITIPHIDDNRIFLGDPLLDIHAGLVRELAGYGYADTYVWNEYYAIRNGQTLKAAGISEDDTMTVGEYERLEEEQKLQKLLDKKLTEETRVFLEQKGIVREDYETLFARFINYSILNIADEQLLDALMDAYESSLFWLGESIYEKYFPPEPTTDPAEISAMVAGFENMSQWERKEWFHEFARMFRVDYIPSFQLGAEPSAEALDYLSWIRLVMEHEKEYNGQLTRKYIEEFVQNYFGIVPTQFNTSERHWIYTEKTQTYTGYPAGSLTPPCDIFFLLHSITFEEGIYTIRYSLYRSPYMYTEPESELRFKTNLFNGDDTELTFRTSNALSFRLDPETNLPIFCGMEAERLS